MLHYKHNPRIEMYRLCRSGARRPDKGLASKSSDEYVATTTDDDLMEEEQELHLRLEIMFLLRPSSLRNPHRVRRGLLC